MAARPLTRLILAAATFALVACGGGTSAGPGDDGPSVGAGTATRSADPSGTDPGAGAVGGRAPAATATVPPAGAARPPRTTTTSDEAPVSTSRPPRGWTATCPTATPSALGCAAVRARVLAIQSYDPDGDGDLHVVAIGGHVTGPGITVFDVRDALRPRRDPVKGEWVTGAGPVFRGSLRQRQIQVDEFRVWRP